MEVLNSITGLAAVGVLAAAVVVEFMTRTRQEIARRERNRALLADAREFIARRGTYWYNSQRRGPGADLVERIDEALDER